MATDATGALKRGRPPIGPDAQELHLRVPAPIYDAIAVEALRRRLPVNEVVRQVLQTHTQQSGTEK